MPGGQIRLDWCLRTYMTLAPTYNLCLLILSKTNDCTPRPLYWKTYASTLTKGNKFHSNTDVCLITWLGVKKVQNRRTEEVPNVELKHRPRLTLEKKTHTTIKVPLAVVRL